MDRHEYRTLLEQLEGELPSWPQAECRQLLGVLERLRVSAWAQVLGGPKESPLSSSSSEGIQLLTVPQVAERLNLPESYAYDLARRGVIPVVRLGKYVRVPLAELKAWVDQQTCLQRRIDRESGDFHSARVPQNRQPRVSMNARTEPGEARRARGGRTLPKPEPKVRVGFQPQPAPPCSRQESGSVKPERSDNTE